MNEAGANFDGELQNILKQLYLYGHRGSTPESDAAARASEAQNAQRANFIAWMKHAIYNRIDPNDYHFQGVVNTMLTNDPNVPDYHPADQEVRAYYARHPGSPNITLVPVHSQIYRMNGANAAPRAEVFSEKRKWWQYMAKSTPRLPYMEKHPLATLRELREDKEAEGKKKEVREIDAAIQELEDLFRAPKKPQ